MSKYRILIVDDDEFVCEDIATSLDSERYDVDTADCAESAFQLFKEKEHHIIITDLEMAENKDDGFTLIQQVRSMASHTAIMIITSHRDFQRAVRAMQLGALDFITKPYEAEQIAIKVKNIADRITLQSENTCLRLELASQHQLIGNSSQMNELRKQIEMIAKADCTVLINGPNGTGKELVARSIRNLSTRAGKPFVIVNCAALPENLIEAELFGTVKGAFTGAADKKGKFELADTGTLFLDEVGDLCPQAQAKLLRVLEYRTFSRIGGVDSIDVDVRVLSATNKNLEKLIEDKAFRRDLYDRLKVVPIETIPLADIREDIPVLVDHLLRKRGAAESVDDIFTEDALSFLQSLDWPGNIRELNNVVERILIFRDSAKLNSQTVRQYINHSSSRPFFPMNDFASLKEATNQFERFVMAKTLQLCGHNKTEAAKKLDISREYLYEKMRKLGLENTAVKNYA